VWLGSLRARLSPAAPQPSLHHGHDVRRTILQAISPNTRHINSQAPTGPKQSTGTQAWEAAQHDTQNSTHVWQHHTAESTRIVEHPVVQQLRWLHTNNKNSPERVLLIN
jgi:hypothetical protein